MILSPEIEFDSGGSVSLPGEYAVPVGVAVGDLVYVSGADAMDQADNASEATAPVKGIVTDKPTTTTATVTYFGRVEGFAGFVPGELLFLGTTGGIVNSAGIPSAVGSYLQKVGVAADTDAILFDPEPGVIL